MMYDNDNNDYAIETSPGHWFFSAGGDSDIIYGWALCSSKEAKRRIDERDYSGLTPSKRY